MHWTKIFKYSVTIWSDTFLWTGVICIQKAIMDPETQFKIQLEKTRIGSIFLLLLHKMY